MIGKRSLVLLVLISFCHLVASENLVLDDKNLSANVTVELKKLDLKVEPGKPGDYPLGKQYKFGLLIGGCDAKIVADLSGSKISFEINVDGNSEKTIKDLNGIAATEEGLTFTGVQSDGNPAQEPFKCSVHFKSSNTKFVTAVALSDNVPRNFKLLPKAEIYTPQDKESEGNLKKGLLIGGGVLAFAILLSVCAVSIFLIRRRQQNARALSEEKAKTTRLEAAKAAEDQLAAEKLANEKVAAENEKLAAEKANNEKKSKIGNSASTNVKKDGNEKKDGDEKKSKSKEDGSGKNKQSKKSQDGKSKVRSSQKTPDYTENGFTVNTIDVGFATRARVISPSEKSYE